MIVNAIIACTMTYKIVELMLSVNKLKNSFGGIECGITTTKSLQRSISAYEFRRRQITAIVMMGVIGAEFSNELDASTIRRNNQDRGKILNNFCNINTVYLAKKCQNFYKNTCNFKNCTR